jgi:hypothetical protein
MDDKKMTRLVERMAAKSTLAECMTVFMDIMEYEGVSNDMRPAFFRRAWAAMGDRQPVRRCAPLSLFWQGACRSESAHPFIQRFTF